MECKFNNAGDIVARVSEIIETYWNVNELEEYYVDVPGAEIIETYWNVNHNSWGDDVKESVEIIETYWNVNLLTFMCISPFSMRNNRNILECK